MLLNLFKYYSAKALGSLALSLSIANTLFIHSANTKVRCCGVRPLVRALSCFFTIVFNSLYLKLAHMPIKGVCALTTWPRCVWTVSFFGLMLRFNCTAR